MDSGECRGQVGGGQMDTRNPVGRPIDSKSQVRGAVDIPGRGGSKEVKEPVLNSIGDFSLSRSVKVSSGRG